MSTDRRTFLQLLTTSALSAAFPSSIARALEIPANNRTGSLADVEHIVILMQENRAFDHYFGTLRGVRGYGDPRAVKLPNGDPVWKQPTSSGGYVMPFHPGAPSLGLQFLEDLAHDWDTTHNALNGGKYDQWVPQKGTTSMAHLVRSDIPFHYALADAFTICDAYHCSFLGATDPNRYHMWTGWVGNDGSGGGPVLDNAEAGYGWSTYPERLASAGISWKIYQDQGAGLTAAEYWGWGSDAYIGNYGDNSLLYFHQYQNSLPGSPLFEAALTGTDISTSGTLFDEFRADIAAGKLPQVSWIVAPEAYTEHPNWPANYGAWYISQFLDALTANPEVWSKTAFFLCYDENDGFFDHVVPPTVPASPAQGLSTVDTVNEYFEGNAEYPAGSIGFGVRVPMIVISPWSKGGYVSSEFFDHTSLIRFIEQRFGPNSPQLVEPNITPWRRAVSGDLTSAFNFKSPNDARVALPSTVAYIPPDANRHPDYVPTPPTDQALPVQESGTRLARPVPYELHVHGTPNFADGTFKIHFGNGGKTVVYQVRSGNSTLGPWNYTVGQGALLSDTWQITANSLSTYDLSINGPNGFLRAFQGSVSGADRANVHVHTSYKPQGNGITLHLENHGASAVDVRITDIYTGSVHTVHLKAGETATKYSERHQTFGWYDFVVEVESDSTFVWQLAGHVETGEESRTDPAIAAE